AQRFVKALFDVYEEGDAMGRPFFFPKPNVHMTDKFFQTEGHEEFLEQISRVAAEKGNTYFVFDRGGTAKISECCRLSFKLEESDLEDAKTPWKMRYSAMQNVTINLPRIAYEAHQDDTKLFQLLTQRIEMAAQAHIQKREFISQLLNLGKDGPLSLLTMNLDGEPYYRIDKSSFLIGMVGLNEMVQYHLGKQMHEGKDAMMFGLKIISYMKQEAERIGNEYGLKMPLEQTPAESTAYRFAKLDMKYYPLQAPTVIRGNKSTGEIYYTNSTYLNVGADVSAIDRVKMEGRFHPLIDAGSMTHVWLGESKPPAESIAAFVKKTFETTQNAQIAFSPEFTSCLSCGRTHRGLRETCPSCSSPDVEGITRVTGFFSKTRGWNKGKLGELRDRTRNIIG
ncbi:MAG TPA: anaerobic ribonucleoside-triphosphate reductase, partial [Methanomassiliicoccaceae archaeon]|nr:anaerobic ribonucleoside-triphosphate reductase [Methanomassiliicoccaceae archaeon]